jgi:hypothetical protein
MLKKAIDTPLGAAHRLEHIRNLLIVTCLQF